MTLMTINWNGETQKGAKAHHNLREWSHFHNILELFVHITNCELTVFDLLDQILVVVQLQFVYFVNQPLDVSHAQ